MSTTYNNITADQVAAMQPQTVSSNNTPSSGIVQGGTAPLTALIDDPSNVLLYKQIASMIMASDSPPPDGLNFNPADDFGVSNDPDTAQEQLLALMEWTSQSGYGKADCAAVWVVAMIGFNMRMHQWTTPGNPNYIDPSDPRYQTVLSIQSSLEALTGASAIMTYKGETKTVTLGEAIAGSIAVYALYYAYKQNGGNLTEANQTLLNELNIVNSSYAKMNHCNPMLDSIVNSLNQLAANPSFESPFVVNGQLVHADWTDKELATWLSTGMWEWSSAPSNNLRAIEGQCRGNWFMAMIDAGEPTVYAICLLLMALMDQYYIDAGALSAQLDLYSNLTDEYSTMMTDASTTNMTDDQAAQMDAAATDIQWQTTYNPRVEAPAAGTAAGQILDITSSGSGTPAENWNNYFNPVQGPDDPNPGEPDTTTQSIEVQQLNTSLQAGSTQLTSYSSNLTTQMQQDMQMIQQIAKTMQTLVEKNSDQINYSISKVSA